MSDFDHSNPVFHVPSHFLAFHLKYPILVCVCIERVCACDHYPLPVGAGVYGLLGASGIHTSFVRLLHCAKSATYRYNRRHQKVYKI